MHHRDEDPRFDDGQPASVDLLHNALRFWRLARRRQAMIGWVVAAHLAAGLVYYTAAPRSYRSSAKLMIIQQTPDQVSTVNEQSSADTIMATHRELVRSPAVIRAAITRLAPHERGDWATAPPKDHARRLRERLSVSTLRKTNVLGVSYRSADPHTAAAVVNAITESYLDFVDTTHGDTAADVLRALTSERDTLNLSLTGKQQELARLRQQVGRLAIDETDGVVDPTINKAIQLNESLIQTQKQRIEKQASLATIRAAVARGEDVRQYLGLIEETVGQQLLLSALGLGAHDQTTLAEQQARLIEVGDELRRVSPHLGPRHPRVVGLQQQAQGIQQYLANYQAGAARRYNAVPAAELAPLLERMLRQAVEQSWQREQQLAASFNAARAEAARHSGALVDLRMREREIDRLERLHDALFEKIAAVDIHQVQGPIRVKPIEEPVADPEPVSPQLRVVLLGSVLLGLVVAVGVVYVQDLLDDRFGDPEEIALQLDLPVLSVVRELEPPEGEGLAAVAMHAAGDSFEMEAFRTLRTALSLHADGAERIAVSSAEPGDGKTTISSNLAVALAQVGKRTLVIDADLRRPGLTALLGLKRAPGVTDVLMTDRDVPAIAAEVVHRTDEPNLHVIPAGPRRPNAPELLPGHNFAELLAWADANYDQVLVDCPPVLAVSDAQIVGRMVDGLLLVMSPEKNHRRLVTRAIDSFRGTGVNVLGVVANRIREDAHAGYGYGYGYGYHYGQGEEGGQEDPANADPDPQRPAADAGDGPRPLAA